MTREEAIRRADEVMAGLGFEDRGRGCLERGRIGERLHSTQLVAGQAAGKDVGDPHWWVNYEAVFIAPDGTTRPTGREQTSVRVDVASGHAVWFRTA